MHGPPSATHNQSRAQPLRPGTQLPSPEPLPTARIFAARAAGSAGRGAMGWTLEFRSLRAPRNDPLMGWTGGSDPYGQVRLNFPDLQSAIEFAERNGWRYTVREPTCSRLKLQSYGDNFRSGVVGEFVSRSRSPTGFTSRNRSSRLLTRSEPGCRV
jgi:hypothetical protein